MKIILNNMFSANLFLAKPVPQNDGKTAATGKYNMSAYGRFVKLICGQAQYSVPTW